MICLLLPLVASLTAGKDPLLEGRAIWRKPGAIQNGAACATCHSPDGIEIAAYDFTDADIARRAKPHLGDEGAQRIVQYIHALRSDLKISDLKNPSSDRPLQPSGSVLPGSTPSDRDQAFGRELQQDLPLLFSARVETVAQAKAAESQLLGLDVRKLRIGFPLSRVSEDATRVSDPESINQWFPVDEPGIPPEFQSDWYTAEDRYLADPSPTNLENLILLHRRYTARDAKTGPERLSALKFRSLLIFQDRLRHPVQPAPALDNPFWEVGEFGREMVERGPAAFPALVANDSRKLTLTQFQTQFGKLRLNWFWLGWLEDQGQFLTSRDDKVRLGLWLSESLSKDGPYPIHNVFANARRQAVISNDPLSWNEPASRRRRIWDFAGLRVFRYYQTDMPKDPEHRKLYVAFTANCFRVNLLLLADSIEKTHEVWIKISTKANVSELARFIATEDPDNAPQVAKLEARLNHLIDSATERY